MRTVCYCRYSTDRQREASIQDQARNCRRRAEAEGWSIVKVFADQAMSGSHADRPAYQAMLSAAAAGEFDVLLLDDLSRLSRDQVESERAIRRLEFGGIRIVAVSDGYDSTHAGRKVHRGVKQLFNEMYVDDQRDKTHRGQTGQALKQFWCGSRPYGYRLVPLLDESRTDAHGQPVRVGTRLVIDPDQAAIVREVFELYASGWSPGRIAAALNQRNVSSPGTAWRNRTVRRVGGWMQSAIRGDDVKGTGILANELYVGRYVWNRSQWIRDPDTRKRTYRLRPQSEWVVNELPELRIVAEDLWAAAQARRREQAERVGAAVRRGIALKNARPPGGIPKYLLSGLMSCGECGSKFIIVNRTSYGCGGYLSGRLCSNKLTVRRELAEDLLLAGIREDLLTPEVEAEVRRRIVRKVRERRVPNTAHTRRAQLQAEIGNLVDAIAGGSLRASSALAGRLARAEKELADLQAAPAPMVAGNVVTLLPRVMTAFRALVADLGRLARHDVVRARTEIRKLVGDVTMRPDGGVLVAEINRARVAGALLGAAGGPQQMVMVAGAGFEPATFGL